MSVKSAVARLVHDARRSKGPADPAPSQADPKLHIHIADAKAKTFLLRGRFRGAEYIKTHVRYVVDMGAEKGEVHIGRNLNAIRRNLEEMGIDPAAITAELRTIESAVRAELWRQILTPDSDDR